MSDPFEIHRGAVPEPYRDVFEKRSFAHVATINPDGSPNTTPVWVDHDGGTHVLINTLRGRRKERNLRRNPTVSLSVTDPDNPYRYVEVSGEATLTQEGAADHIDRLARKYLDAETYPHHDEEDEPRVTVRIPAERVVTRGRSQDR